MKNNKILTVENLKVQFLNREKLKFSARKSGKWKIVLDSISFSINENETFGIVGETGSGKSTLARTLMGIYKPVEGRVTFMGKEINFKKKDDLIFLRKNIGIVFQDPVGSLNPRLRIREIIREGLFTDVKLSKTEQNSRIEEVSDLVGLARSKLDAYPNEISGGEKQRVSLARALVNNKKILILDEPTSSLDVSIQAQILNLLRKLRDELSITYIFITHDFNVIRYMCDRIGVLYYGQILEISSVHDIYENPLHPYSSDLMNANITLDTVDKFDSQYEVGEPSRSGCIYLNSCSRKFEKCNVVPPSFDINGRIVKCWLYENDTKLHDDVSLKQ